MKKLFLVAIMSAGLFATKVQAQQTFEQRAQEISQRIYNITTEEKAALKLEIESVNKQLDSGSITAEQADEKKIKLANDRAKSIEVRVAPEQQALQDLVQERVDGKIVVNDSVKKKHSFEMKMGKSKKEGESRTTSQVTIALGANNVVTNGAVANSDFGYLRSRFFEWGLTKNTRIMKENNLLHFRYGVGFQYNVLAATQDRIFQDIGDQTVLVSSPINLRNKETYFKNVYVVVPLHLEFDFSGTEIKDDKTIFKAQQGFRIGLGGFAGYNTNSKQFTSFKLNGYTTDSRTKGDYNVNDFNYGVSAYIGFRDMSLYCKYDLNPIFKNNPVQQRNASLGLRFDIN